MSFNIALATTIRKMSVRCIVNERAHRLSQHPIVSIQQPLSRLHYNLFWGQKFCRRLGPGVILQKFLVARAAQTNRKIGLDSQPLRFIEDAFEGQRLKICDEQEMQQTYLFVKQFSFVLFLFIVYSMFSKRSHNYHIRIVYVYIQFYIFAPIMAIQNVKAFSQKNLQKKL